MAAVCIWSIKHIYRRYLRLEKKMDEDELRGVVLLVLANKQDLPNAMSVCDITDSLGLRTLTTPWFVQATCASQGSGLVEGMDWLAEQMSNH